jgi:hypothetical protein
MASNIEVFHRLLVQPEPELKILSGWSVGSYHWRWHPDLPAPIALGPGRVVGTWSDDRWSIRPGAPNFEFFEISRSFEEMRALEFESTFPAAAKSLARYWLWI